jgi:hypothetical protein
MMDRLLALTMNFTIVGLIAVTGVGSLLTAYWGLFELVSARATNGGCALGCGVAVALVSYKMAKYRNDLVDR